MCALRGPNQGLAATRNFMCAHATGDYLAFLGADDIWHKRYLAVQQELITRHPGAAGWFTAQHTFVAGEALEWSDDISSETVPIELIDPRAFVQRYNRTPLRFQISCFCMPREALGRLGSEPSFT